MDKFVLLCVTKRWDLISDFVHAAAYSIDPRFRDEELEICHLDDAETYLKGAAPRAWFMSPSRPEPRSVRRE